MLKTIYFDNYRNTSCALMLGGFDGLHTGHLTLLDAAQKTGLPVAVTSISGNKRGGDVFTLPERQYIYRKNGISIDIEINFTDETKNTTAQDFLRRLFAEVNAGAVFCGEDFRFGKGALGTPQLLKALAPCPVTVLPLKTENGEKVAVSAVKEFLARGDLPAANRLLSGGYFLQGVVEHGRQVGRTYGFPTLNLSYPAGKYPVREGVYGGYAETPCGTFGAIVNFGARPTFGVEEKKAEAYLQGFSGDLYGAEVRLYPTEFYRPITKFENAAALRAQLEEDIGRLKYVL